MNHTAEAVTVREVGLRGAHAMLMPRSASQAHSLANLRRRPEGAVAELAAIAAARDRQAAGTGRRLFTKARARHGQRIAFGHCHDITRAGLPRPLQPQAVKA
jgi:cytochrome c peroxidase